MVLFSNEEILRLREKLKNDMSHVDRLREGCESLLKQGINIPKSGVATWGHYFACAKDAARLKYEYDCDHDFRCPVCGEIYNGEPYLGAWWRITNTVNTGTAVNGALLWVLNDDEECRKLSAEILLGYADNYPNYEEHGDIPYNKPGRMNSQLICEAECLKSLAEAYDLIKDSLSDAERRHIENDLLFPGAALLKKNRTEQIHNHEVIVNAAIGIIGLATGREELTDFAVNSPYGLIYQLEHGVLEDGLWFEATLHYHYFALLAFMGFEKMARGTKFSLLSRPEYLRMYKMPLKILRPDYDLPAIGDGGYSFGLRALADHYEFVYNVYKDREFAALLKIAYYPYLYAPRKSFQAFLYGAERIEEAELTLDDYHNDAASGLTVLRGRDKKQYLLFRHGRFGGEHDHYDKLGLHYSVERYDVMPDLGTVAYGSPPHYGYFKNTFTHNTVCIDGQNQPPCNGRTNLYRKYDDLTLVEGHADWLAPAQLPESFVIRQWDEAAYSGVSMDRTILFTDEFFLEAFRVRGAKGRQVDWIIHPKGRCLKVNLPEQPFQLTGCKPAEYFKNARVSESGRTVKSVWKSEAGYFGVFSFCSVPAQVIRAEAPGNPMSEELTYLIRRVPEAPDDLVFATAFRLSRDKSDIKNMHIKISGGTVRMSFTLNDIPREYSFTVGETQNN